MHSAEKAAPELFAKWLIQSLAAALILLSICNGWGPLIRACGHMIKRLVVGLTDLTLSLSSSCGMASPETSNNQIPKPRDGQSFPVRPGTLCLCFGQSVLASPSSDVKL